MKSRFLVPVLPLMAALMGAPTPTAPPATAPAAGAAPAAAATAGDPLDALVADSPFGAPAGGGRAATPGATGPLELRSVVFVDGAYQFSVFDQGSGKADWVKIGEHGFPFIARSFNQERDALTVEHQGRTMVLSLQAAKTGTAAGNQPPPSPSPLPGANRNGQAQVPGAQTNANAGSPNGGPGPANGNANANGGVPAPPSATSNTNAAEAQRLQNLADEIRRRRGSGPQLVLPRKN